MAPKKEFQKKTEVQSGQTDPIRFHVQSSVGALTKSAKRCILIGKIGRLCAAVLDGRQLAATISSLVTCQSSVVRRERNEVGRKIERIRCRSRRASRRRASPSQKLPPAAICCHFVAAKLLRPFQPLNSQVRSPARFEKMAPYTRFLGLLAGRTSRVPPI